LQEYSIVLFQELEIITSTYVTLLPHTHTR
jgi:hypothetical protein